MKASRSFPFGGVPVYNPQSLSKDEALAQFHSRQAAYTDLINLLRQERPSHVLLIGTRGMGKTTLLQRVRYGVEDDPGLRKRYLPLVFPEEQYNVNRLHHFFLNTIDALADAMERAGNRRVLAQVETFAETAGKLSPEVVEAEIPKFIEQIGRDLDVSFLLLVDNADRLFETLEDRQQWQLRELLLGRADLTFFGATTQASEGIYGPKRAFFEFFQIQRLPPLTFEEVRSLLLRLSESVEEREKGSARRRVQEWLAADAARLRTLVQLTGGNPRTTVVLFHLVLDGLEGGAREYLEQLLDQCTPNYKGRVDELPAQAQQVLDAVALRWYPVTAAEVSEDTRLETSAVSTQLTRLVRQGVLEKADPGDSKKALYQVAERFFNIWYLMRASRRVRAKLRWFVEFLRVFFDRGELEAMAQERMERFRGTGKPGTFELENAFACIVAAGADASSYEEYLRRECADAEAVWRPYMELARSERPTESKNPSSLESERVGKVLITITAYLQNLSVGAVSPEQRDLAEAAIRQVIEAFPLSPSPYVLLTAVLLTELTRLDEAEAACRHALQLDPQDAFSWILLGTILQRLHRDSEAEEAFEKAISLDQKSTSAWYAWGTFLASRQGRRHEAEDAFRKGLAVDDKSFSLWRSLGDLLVGSADRPSEAETAYRNALELDPQSAEAWNNLGAAIMKGGERLNEAESSFRKAVELAPGNEACWSNLGNLLTRDSRFVQEAETAFRTAINLEPFSIPGWAGLFSLLVQRPERWTDAEAAIRRCTELDPESALFAAGLNLMLDAQRNGGESDTSTLLSTANRTGDIFRFSVRIYCQAPNRSDSVIFLRELHRRHPGDPIAAAILATSAPAILDGYDPGDSYLEASKAPAFWEELLALGETYPSFWKTLLKICDLVPANPSEMLARATALAHEGDFPRAIVTLDDALTGDPIEHLAAGRRALELFLGAAVKNGRAKDCLDLIEKKDWKDAWRPIYEALRAVEAGTPDYLKRVAVEIREPATTILSRIAPDLVPQALS